MAAEKINQLFWLNYAQVVKDKAGLGLGDNKKFLVCADNLQAPVTGEGVPAEYTNAAMFDIGNKLLSPGDLFNNSSTEYGYVQAMQSYLAWVDMGRYAPPPVQMRLTGACKDFEKSQRDYVAETISALQRFEKELNRGVTSAQNFPDWLRNGNAPRLQQVEMSLQMTSSQIDQLQLQCGPESSSIVNSRSSIARSCTIETNNPGSNMRCAVGFSDRIALLHKLQSTQDVDLPCYTRKSTYLAPKYKTFAAEAQALAEQPIDFTKMVSMSFAVNTSTDLSSFRLGQVTASGSRLPSWISFATPRKNGEGSTLDITDEEASGVSVKVFFDKMESIEINPGAWHPGNISSYRPRNDAPTHLRTLARVSAFIVASRLSFQITVSDSLAQKLDSEIKETAKDNGSLSVFGTRCVLGDQDWDSDSKDHKAEWDGGAKTLTVKPRHDLAAATVLALVGEKLHA